jgi:peptide/nickel transport system ATP-binding protein
VQQILEQARHPYTNALIAAAPSRNPRGSLLQQIPGMTPSLLQLPAGCAFQQRCQLASATCTQIPELTVIGQGEQQRSLRCFHPLTSTSAALNEH